MKLRLMGWANSNRTLLSNAGSLIGTTAVTSGLGFVYWWLAARSFSSEAVGFASAMVSAMMLLGNLGMMGLGTFLIGELPRRRGEAGRWISTSLLVSGLLSGVLGVTFAFIASRLFVEFEPLAHTLATTALFVSGVTLTTITLVLDQALIGLFRGEFQFLRNTFFAVAKLVVLLLAGVVLALNSGFAIYASWAIGSLISLILLAALFVWRGLLVDIRPHWSLIQRAGLPALSHHVLNIALQFPSFVLPILVTILLSPQLNASFYVAWMIASFVFVVPIALTTILYAVGAADLSLLASKMQFTLRLSLVAGLIAVGSLWIGASYVLRLFGTIYALDAEWSLRILTLGVFPLIIKVHYVAIRRIFGCINATAIIIMIASIFEITLAAIGASVNGLVGLSVGWFIAVCVEAVFTLPYVYRTAVLSSNEVGLKQIENE